MIAFDEAHAAKHARSGSGHSRAGEAVLTLSRGLPLARVLYASATAATEIAHMGYLDRHVSGGLDPHPDHDAKYSCAD